MNLLLSLLLMLGSVGCVYAACTTMGSVGNMFILLSGVLILMNDIHWALYENLNIQKG